MCIRVRVLVHARVVYVCARVSARAIANACVQICVCTNVRVCMHESVLANAPACK